CNGCDYAANTEVARGKPPYDHDFGDANLEKIHTPDMYTVAHIADLLKVEPRQILKTLVYETENDPVAVLVPGDRELNEFKLAKVLGREATMLTDFERHGIPKGYIG